MEDDYSSVKYERRWRLRMNAVDVSPALGLFFSALDFRLPSGAVRSDTIDRALQWATEIDYRHGGTSSTVYLNHPLRVATLLAENLSLLDVDTIVIALFHNVLEVSALSEEDIRARLGSSVAESIIALTVDRSRQYDPIYKQDYYMRIEATSLACARVKVADKLDNIYMLSFNPDSEVRCQYLDEIDRWVVPMANRVLPVLGSRMKNVSQVVREIGFLNKDDELHLALQKEKEV